MADLLSIPFGVAGVTVHPERNVIERAGAEARLEPRVMDVLRLLAAQSGEVLSRSDMIDALWGVEFGGDESLTRAISRLRGALKQIGADSGLVETVPKRGYRLVAHVYALETHPAPDPVQDVSAQGGSQSTAGSSSTPLDTRLPTLNAIITSLFGGAQTLRRRRVVRAALIYAAFSVAIFSLVEAAAGPFQIGAAMQRVILGGVLVGFPLFLVVAWMTSAGLATSDDAEVAADRRREDRVDIAIISAVVAGVALAVFRLATISEPTESAQLRAEPYDVGAIGLSEVPSNSVAVLPFECAGATPRDQILCRGVAFETINLLSGVNGLRVNSSTHSLRLDLDGMSAVEIAGMLGVAHLLSGRLHRDGDRLRVTVELSDARTNSIVAATALSMTLNDDLSAQESVANAVLEGLGIDERVATPERVDPLSEAEIAGATAMESFSQARWLLAQREAGPTRRALQLLEALSERFPNVADIHASLAIAHLLNADTQYGDVDVPRAVALARPHIERARGLEPDLAEAFAADGLAALSEGRWRTSATQLEQAIERLPGRGDFWTWLAIARSGGGDIIAARRALRSAIELDPLSPVVFSAFSEGFAGSDPNAVAAARTRYARAFPDDARLVRADVSVQLARGDLSAAHRAIRALEAPAPALAALEQEELGWIYWRLGLAGAARRAWGQSAPQSEIDALLAYRSGRCTDAVRLSESDVNADVRSANQQRIRQAIYAACANDWPRTNRLLSQAHTGLGADDQALFLIWPEAPAAPAALMVVAARLTNGEADDVLTTLRGYTSRLRRLQTENLASPRELALAEAYLAAAENDPVSAFEAFSRAMDAGHREPPLLDPLLAPWRDTPAMTALATRFEAVMGPHRQRVGEDLNAASLE